MPTTRPQHPIRSRGPSARARRVLLVLALTTCLALLVAACGGSSNNSSGASQSSSSGASQAASSGGSGTAASTAEIAKAQKFSQCMRAHGEPQFPDPNAQGQIQLVVTKGGSLNPQSATYQSAIQACKSLEPPGFGNAPGSTTAGQNQLLKFVSCMRNNGVKNFPDPGSQGQLVVSSSSGIDPKSPAFQAAMQKCRSLLPGGGSGASAG